MWGSPLVHLCFPPPSPVVSPSAPGLLWLVSLLGQAVESTGDPWRSCWRSTTPFMETKKHIALRIVCCFHFVQGQRCFCCKVFSLKKWWNKNLDKDTRHLENCIEHRNNVIPAKFMWVYSSLLFVLCPLLATHEMFVGPHLSRSSTHFLVYMGLIYHRFMSLTTGWRTNTV